MVGTEGSGVGRLPKKVSLWPSRLGGYVRPPVAVGAMVLSFKERGVDEVRK